MAKSLVIFVSSFFIISSNAYSQDSSKGEKLFKACISCHGAQGLGDSSQEAPRISGQYDWYIYNSLVKFKKGERKNPKMMPYIKNLSDQDFKDLAAYVSGMKI